jgi:hypothetical protein
VLALVHEFRRRAKSPATWSKDGEQSVNWNFPAMIGPKTGKQLNHGTCAGTAFRRILEEIRQLRFAAEAARVVTGVRASAERA